MADHLHFLYFLPVLLMIPLIKRKRIIYPSMIILFVVLFSSQCKKEETPTHCEVQLEEMTETINNLLPNTTYYWKIKAHPKNQDDFYSATLGMIQVIPEFLNKQTY